MINLLPQLLNLLPELPDELHVGILVDGRLVDDVLGSVGVAERREGLTVVAVSWGYLKLNQLLGRYVSIIYIYIKFHTDSLSRYRYGDKQTHSET